MMPMTLQRILAFTSFFTLFLLASCSSAAPDPSIAWQQWSPAVFAQAKDEHKRVLVYGKVDWCHWCKAANTTTFIDPGVIEVIQKDYVPVKVDLDKDRAVAKQFQIKGLPTVIVLDEQGREVKRFSGYYLPNSLHKQLVKYSLHPEPSV